MGRHMLWATVNNILLYYEKQILVLVSEISVTEIELFSGMNAKSIELIMDSDLVTYELALFNYY